jgi:hypothetical protein
MKVSVIELNKQTKLNYDLISVRDSKGSNICFNLDSNGMATFETIQVSEINSFTIKSLNTH